MKKYIKPSIEIEKLITETILVGSIETNAGEQNESDRAYRLCQGFKTA